MIASPSQAIALLGGKHAVCALTKKPLTTVASWAAREAIPVEAWGKLIAIAEQKGVDGFSYEALAEAHTRVPRKARKRRATPKRRRRAA